jgi:carboxypeptidase C (cathepsin A)
MIKINPSPLEKPMRCISDEVAGCKATRLRAKRCPAVMAAGFLLLVVVCTEVAVAQSVSSAAPASAAAGFSPREFVTHHEGVFGGEKIHYSAIAGDTVLTNDAGNPAATIFSFTYLRDDVKDRAARPVFFVFNGGPRSSSVWMHLGFFGPRRVALGDAVNPPLTPPFSLQDNPYTILDIADVVLIDPVGTGFSHLLPAGNAKQYYGVEQDGRATVEFIEAWLNRQGRMNSPKYVVGESYGVTRAIVVARMLMGGPFTETGRLTAIPLNGVVIMGGSPTENFGKEPGDISYVNALPTMAATAWYHKKAGAAGSTLEGVIAEAQNFAGDEYLKALYAGDRLDAEAEKRIARRMAALTGLSADFIMQKKLRVSMEDFRTELLLERGLVVGAYDSRFTLPAGVDTGPLDPVTDDPAMGKFSAAFVGAMDVYLRDELKIKVDSPYEAIAFKSVNGAWDYGPGSKPGGPSTRAEDLAAVMRRNSHLQLLAASGDYDCVATLGAAAYGIAHSGLALDHVSVRTYPAGHMVYLSDEGSAAFAADLRKLVSSTTAHH